MSGKMSRAEDQNNEASVIARPQPSLATTVSEKTAFAINYLQDHSVPFISAQCPSWPADATAFNLRVPATPALLVYAQSVQNVQNAVDCGTAAGLKVSARGGGHSYTSLGLGGEDDHLIVDLTHMNSISVNTDTHIATVGAGARLGDVARGLFDQGGRAISHGSCPAVGLSGHILHGGYGWASHNYGLALDWMVGAHVVLANGAHVYCSQTTKNDLFWALRGAGSNFGIVTSYELATFSAPSVSIPFKVSLNWKDEHHKIDGVTAFVSYTKNMPANLNMRLNMHSSGDHSLDGVYYGKESELPALLGPLLETAGGKLGMQACNWIQGLEYYAERNSLLPSTNEQGNFYATSLTLKELQCKSLADFVHYWHNNALAFTRGGWFAQLDAHGGVNSAVSAVSNSETAYAHRDKAFLIQFYHFSDDDGPYPANGISLLKGWVNATTENLQDGDYGMYINYADSQLDRGTAQKLYWAGNLERLKLIKKTYDPTELFYSPQSIEPAK